jgi:DNA-binding winged helix-turn-helix (wHTH) protein
MPIRFGDFTVDATSRLLAAGDGPRHLSPKAFELLCLLLQHRPRALSKAELHERLWPATFVSDSTLTSVVAELRAALGEDARDGLLIRTVHRFGYAFAGTATELGERAPARAARCWVVWKWGRTPLGDGEHMLGRAADVAVWLESPTVSRHHARLRVSGTEVIVEDLLSKNGTYLHGQRLREPATVCDGDEIRLGAARVSVRMVEGVGSTVTQANAPSS